MPRPAGSGWTGGRSGTRRTSLASPRPCLDRRPGGRASGLLWLCPFHADRNPSFQVDLERGPGGAGPAGLVARPSALSCESEGIVFPRPSAAPSPTGPGWRSATSPIKSPPWRPARPRPLLVPSRRPVSERGRGPRGRSGTQALDARGSPAELPAPARAYRPDHQGRRLGVAPSLWVPTRDGDRFMNASGAIIPGVRGYPVYASQ